METICIQRDLQIHSQIKLLKKNGKLTWSHFSLLFLLSFSLLLFLWYTHECTHTHSHPKAFKTEWEKLFRLKIHHLIVLRITPDTLHGSICNIHSFIRKLHFRPLKTLPKASSLLSALQCDVYQRGNLAFFFFLLLLLFFLLPLFSGYIGQSEKRKF